jgi:hypothetical protein
MARSGRGTDFRDFSRLKETRNIRRKTIDRKILEMRKLLVIVI